MTGPLGFLDDFEGGPLETVSSGLISTPVARALLGTVGKAREVDNAATPWRVVKALEVEFGTFDLDPCCTANTAKAKWFMTSSVDGLKQEWRGRVFCNPPYSTKDRWIKKAYESARKGCLVVMLLPARIEAAWFRDLIAGRAEVRMIPDRINFEGANGKVVRPRDGCMLVIFRPLGTYPIGA